MLITAAQLTQISPSVKGRLAEVWAEKLSTICPQYGIDTADEFHEFIANVLVECKSFTSFSENLNYSIKGLVKTFSRARISMDDCTRFGRIDGKRAANQQAIANIVYGGSFGRKNLGNIYPNDGWLMRGSGPKQITGRGNMTEFTKFHNAKFGTSYTPEQMAELLRTDHNIGLHGACWFYVHKAKLLAASVEDRFLYICKTINGGMNGYEDRLYFYERAKLVMPIV